MKPGAWLAIALLLGVAVGLGYAWGVNPVAYYDTYPPLMHEEYRADWIRMTAFAYGHEGNLSRAQARLQGLSEQEIQRYLAQALEEAVATGRPVPVLRNMAMLAQSYGIDSPAVKVYTSSQAASLPVVPLVQPSVSPSPVLTVPVSSPTPSPTATPRFIPLPITPTPFTVPYSVDEQIPTCSSEPRIAISLTRVVTTTVRGRERSEVQEVPGVEVWLLWEGEADRAVTGLRPAQGLGYADFLVDPGKTYNLYIGSPTGVPLATLDIAPCESDSGTSWLVQVHATE